jgi:hypothetical protein
MCFQRQRLLLRASSRCGNALAFTNHPEGGIVHQKYPHANVGVMNNRLRIAEWRGASVSRRTCRLFNTTPRNSADGVEFGECGVFCIRVYRWDPRFSSSAGEMARRSERRRRDGRNGAAVGRPLHNNERLWRLCWCGPWLIWSRELISKHDNQYA